MGFNLSNGGGRYRPATQAFIIFTQGRATNPLSGPTNGARDI